MPVEIGKPVVLYVQGNRADNAYYNYERILYRRLVAERGIKSVSVVIWPDGGWRWRMTKEPGRSTDGDVYDSAELARSGEDFMDTLASVVPDPGGFVQGLAKCEKVNPDRHAEIVILGHRLEDDFLPTSSRKALDELSSRRTVHFIAFESELTGMEKVLSGYLLMVKEGTGPFAPN